MKTFPVRKGDYLHNGPECIFSSYLTGDDADIAIGGLSAWSRKQAGSHPPREENRVLFASIGWVRTSPIFLKRRTYILRTHNAQRTVDHKPCRSRWALKFKSVIPIISWTSSSSWWEKPRLIRSYRLGANHRCFSSSGGWILRQEVLVCDENIFCTKRGLSSSRAESLLCVVLESEIRDPENKLDVILLMRRNRVLFASTG